MFGDLLDHMALISDNGAGVVCRGEVVYKSVVDPDTIQELIRLYDVSADYILGLSPIMGHAPESVGAAGTSTAAPAIASDPDVHEML